MRVRRGVKVRGEFQDDCLCVHARLLISNWDS